MQRIVHYVAISLDGYIAGHDEDISGFIPSGPGVDRYLEDLQQFKTVIMGRKTYEFGYSFGLKPGVAPYPWMKNIVFSTWLYFDQKSEVEIASLDLDKINQIRRESETDIYLCGGGDLAMWLLENRQIDLIKVKLNPLILGKGIRLFGDNQSQFNCEFVEQESFEDGLQIITYKVLYN